MTERLYLDDAYLRECDATVQRVDGDLVVLDRTVLYAESGGQAADHGSLRWDGGEARVVDAQVAGGGHVGEARPACAMPPFRRRSSGGSCPRSGGTLRHTSSSARHSPWIRTRRRTPRRSRRTPRT